MKPQQDPSHGSPPWWKFGYVWLLISGPLVVVFAGFATLSCARC
jgi:hypothetical protein